MGLVPRDTKAQPDPGVNPWKMQSTVGRPTSKGRKTVSCALYGRYITGASSLKNKELFTIKLITSYKKIMTTTTIPTIIISPAVPTVAPPPQPYNPRLEPDYADDSLSFHSPFHLSPTFSPRPRSISGVSDDGISSYNTSTVDLSTVDGEYGTRTTVYHIYHAGHKGNNFTAHRIKDTELVEQLHEEIGPVILERGSCGSSCNLARGLNTLNSPPLKKIKPDDNKTDPRKAAYYLHSPCLWFHEPPQTLRFGADKNAPIVCLIKGSFFWRTWRLDFIVPEDGKKSKKNKSKEKDRKALEMTQRVDSGFDEGESKGVDDINKETERRWKGLNEPGIIDPRGVLVSQYPLRASGHRPGESGKEYVTEQVRRRKSSLITPEQVVSRINRSSSFSKRAWELFCPRGSSYLTTATPPPTPEPEILTELLLGEPNPQDLPGHLRPDSLYEGSVLMKWSGWLTREYQFIYKGVDLRWKGTGTVKDEKKYFGSWSRYNHLKLVAILPDSDEEEPREVEQKKEEEEEGLNVSGRKLRRRGSFSSFVSLVGRRDPGVSVLEPEKGNERPKGRQVVIAKYTCLAARRKAGRLTVYEHGLEQATSVHVKSKNENEFNTEKERLRHLTVATALCMLQGEKEKRDTVLKIVEVVLLAGTDGI